MKAENKRKMQIAINLYGIMLAGVLVGIGIGIHDNIILLFGVISVFCVVCWSILDGIL